MRRFVVRLIAAWMISSSCTYFVHPLAADPPPAPELNSIEPFVLRVGETNQITLKGKHLQNLKSIWTSRQGIIPSEKLSPQTNKQGTSVSIQFLVDPSMAVGPIALRTITETGISDPEMAFLETMPVLSIAEDRTMQGNGYLSGTLEDDAGLTVRIALGKNEELPLSVFAGRIGSKLDPVLTIHGSNGREELYIQDSPNSSVDCWHEFTAPRKDDYTVRIRDVRYGSGKNYRYHVRFGQASAGILASGVVGSRYVDISRSGGRARVPEPQRLTKRKESYYATELTQKPLGVVSFSDTDLGRPTGSHSLDHFSAVANYPVGMVESFGGRERGGYSSPGLSLNGSFAQPDEVRTVELNIDQPGHYRWTAISRRLGEWSDPAMRLRTEDGKLLKESHMFNNESTLSYAFEAKGTYVMELWDVAGQFGPYASFHIQAQKDPAEFELNTEVDSIRVEPGKDATLKIGIDRDGYSGPVRFMITTPVEGLSLSDAVAKKNSKETTITINASETLPPRTTFPIKISGYRGEKVEAPRSPLYTQAYWKKQFRDLYSPMFEFEDTIWVTVLPKPLPKDSEQNHPPATESE